MEAILAAGRIISFAKKVGYDPQKVCELAGDVFSDEDYKVVTNKYEFTARFKLPKRS